MIYVMEIVSMLWKVKPKTWNIWSWILQRTLASELLWEMIWFYCYEGESKIAFLKFMLWFTITSLLRFPSSDVKITVVTLRVTLAQNSVSMIGKFFFKQVLIMDCIDNHNTPPHMINLQKARYLKSLYN